MAFLFVSLLSLVRKQFTDFNSPMIKEKAGKAGREELLKFSNQNTFLKGNIALIIIIAVAFFSRIYHLTYQSLWSDELYTMVNANPALPLQKILTEIKTNDFHPPLSYLLLHYLFKVVTYNDFVGRLTSALVGTLSVGAMYYFGREIKSKKTGLVMALFTTVNYLHLHYSQEIRMYIWLFLFTILSAIFFLRSIKTGKSIDYILYVLFTTSLIYTHYFGLFVFGAEILCFFHLMWRKLNPVIIKKGLLAGFAVLLLYLPWVPNLLFSGTREHWMGLPKLNFIIFYLYKTLGKDPVSFAFYVLGLMGFFRCLYSLSKKENTPSYVSYLLVTYGLLSVYIITYFVSILKPILQLKCTIAALPFLIAALVIGLDTFKKHYGRIGITLVTISAIINILFIRKHYTKITNDNENYRDIALTVASRHSRVPAISHYADYYNYYFDQFGSKIRAINTKGKDPAAIIGKPTELTVLYAHGGKELMSFNLIRDKKLSSYLKRFYYLKRTYFLNNGLEKAFVYVRKN